MVFALDGTDTFEGSDGNDTFDGGDQVDTVDYSGLAGINFITITLAGASDATVIVDGGDDLSLIHI